MSQVAEMVAELQEYHRQVEEIKRDAEDLVKGLSEAQFNWRLAPGRWSIGECLEHLNATARLYFPVIAQAINEARMKGWLSKGPFKHGWLGKLLVRSAEPPVKMKFKAPRSFRPPADQPMAQVYPQFMSAQDRLLDLIRDANGVDLGRPRVPLPASRLIKLTLGQGIGLITAHERRHLWQARQVKEDPNFPR